MKKRLHLLFPVICLVSWMALNGQKAQTIRIGVCTDVHIPTMHDSKYRISTFIEAMKKQKPDFIIELGDFITPDKKYAECYEIWKSFPGEKYHVIGNHDMDGGTTLQKALAYRGMKSSYYSFDKNGFHFIVLDGNDWKSPAIKGYRQYIGPQQAIWLQADLAQAVNPVVIFSHQGLVLYKGVEEYVGIENYQDIQDLIITHNQQNPGKKVIACINGHSHWDYAESINGVWYISITSMAYHWLGEKYAHIRYSTEVDKNFKWIKYTAPFKEPLFTMVTLSTNGSITIAGNKTAWVGPSPWEVGYPDSLKKFMRPAITRRKLKFSLH